MLRGSSPWPLPRPHPCAGATDRCGLRSSLKGFPGTSRLGAVGWLTSVGSAWPWPGLASQPCLPSPHSAGSRAVLGWAPDPGRHGFPGPPWGQPRLPRAHPLLQDSWAATLNNPAASGSGSLGASPWGLWACTATLGSCPTKGARMPCSPAGTCDSALWRPPSGPCSWGAPPGASRAPSCAWGLASPCGLGTPKSKTNTSLGKRAPRASGRDPDGCFANAYAFLRVRGPPARASATDLVAAWFPGVPAHCLMRMPQNTNVCSGGRTACRDTCHHAGWYVLYLTTWWPPSPWHLHLASFALFHLSLGLRGWEGPAKPTRPVHGKVFRAYIPSLLVVGDPGASDAPEPFRPCEVIG